MANKDERIVTATARKVIVRIDKIRTVLTDEESRIFEGLIDKLRKQGAQ